jgi:Domain of unknown function (DUF4262)
MRNLRGTHDEDCECCKKGMDTFLAETEVLIKRYGHTVISTEMENDKGAFIPMAYTAGLSDNGLPEIICFGLPRRAGHILLNDAAELLRKNKLPLDTAIPELAVGFPLVFKRVPAEQGVSYINLANYRAGRPVDLIQLIWPDEQSRFPWDAEFDPLMRDAQPLLF